MSDVATKVESIRARMRVACEAAGRESSSVRLLPVSKTKPSSAIRRVAELGLTRFGENKVQEARAKAQELADTPEISWAVIGHVQTNKARFLVEFASEFQALDSLKLAAQLNDRFATAGRALDVLIEVNSSGEASKFGLSPDDVIAFAQALRPFEALSVRGLMTVAARGRASACFAEMAGLRERLWASDGLPGTYDELSMGMSGDFEEAIAQGSTCVRVGTAIFGDRDTTA